jgi:lauroyl/myristoyl acyltransferase
MTSVRRRSPLDEAMGRCGRRYLQARYMDFLHAVIGDEIFVEDEDCSLAIVRRLREGGLVSIHLDAESRAQSVELPFLGGRSRFALGLVHLSRLTGAAVLPFWFRGNRHRLEIEIEAPVDMLGEPSCIITELVVRLERRALASPDQYEGWITLS